MFVSDLLPFNGQGGGVQLFPLLGTSIYFQRRHVASDDFPSRIEDYVHRIGRTGRNDKPGRPLPSYGCFLWVTNDFYQTQGHFDIRELIWTNVLPTVEGF